MKSRWEDSVAASFGDDPLAMRVYTSRLIGQEPGLVLHGGGNTSVKAPYTDAFGDEHELLYVKGSGWDLATIEAEGFAPVRLNVLQRMAELESLSDSDMVSMQRAAMINPYAPNPSVEAVLHAVIPFRFVDHTHADAVVTITNTPAGMERIADLYGDRVFIVPYVMPGFLLAKEIYEATRDVDWRQLEAMILMNHGVFTFADDARGAYERMVNLVSEAERYLENNAVVESPTIQPPKEDLKRLARIRRNVSDVAGVAMIARVDDSISAISFSNREDVADVATRGPLTPDHVIRTKQIPVILGDDPEASIDAYVAAYREYFDRHTDGTLTILDPAPRWAVWPGVGTINFGKSLADANIVADITSHTLKAIERAQALDEWRALPDDAIFEVEYWELEQAKLAKAGEPKAFAGRVALVTGAASGIGRACVDELVANGAVVGAVDRSSDVSTAFASPRVKPVQADVTRDTDLQRAVEAVVREFGGLDLVVSNAGTFPANAGIAELDRETWDASLAVNLTAHERLLHVAAPFLQQGVDPAVVLVGSKNVIAPGPGAAAYSVAKAGLAQLGRVAALEWAPLGIRVNIVHPNDVFDTALWTDDVLSERADRYGLSVSEYKSRNLLSREITSNDVAALVAQMLGPAFSRTTGAQVPIDGGNDRVI